MNLVLAVVLTASCCIRAPSCSRYEDQAGGRRRGHRGFAGRAGRHPARRSHRRRSATSDVKTWEDFYIAVGTRRTAKLADRLRARRRRSRRATVTPVPSPSRAGSRSATSASCRTCIRTSASVRPASRPSAPGCKAGDVVLAIDGQPITFSSAACESAIAKHPDQPITMSILRDGAPMTVHGDARQARRRRLARHRHRRRDGQHQAGRSSTRSA